MKRKNVAHVAKRLRRLWTAAWPPIIGSILGITLFCLWVIAG